MPTSFLLQFAELVTPENPIARDLDWLGPVVTAIGGVLVATVGGISLAWRRKQDRQESKEELAAAAAPKIVDGWEEVRKARAEATSYYNLYRIFEGMYHTTATALRRLARRVREAHPKEEFEQEVLDALAIEPPETSNKQQKNN